MPEITSGAFWDATIYSPREKKNLSLELKKGLDPNKYGAFSSQKFAYFFAYKALKKGRPMFCFSGVPVSVAEAAECNEKVLERQAEEEARKNKLEFVSIVRRKIPKGQLIEVAGSRYFVRGIKEVRNGQQLAFTVGETADMNLAHTVIYKVLQLVDIIFVFCRNKHNIYSLFL